MAVKQIFANGLNWKAIKNTVKKKTIKGSLLHTLKPTKKIKRRTKALNIQLNRRTVRKSYHWYVTTKTSILRNITDNEDTDDDVKPYRIGIDSSDYNSSFISQCLSPRKRLSVDSLYSDSANDTDITNLSGTSKSRKRINDTIGSNSSAPSPKRTCRKNKVAPQPTLVDHDEKQEKRLLNVKRNLTSLLKDVEDNRSIVGESIEIDQRDSYEFEQNSELHDSVQFKNVSNKKTSETTGFVANKISINGDGGSSDKPLIRSIGASPNLEKEEESKDGSFNSDVVYDADCGKLLRKQRSRKGKSKAPESQSSGKLANENLLANKNVPRADSVDRDETQEKGLMNVKRNRPSLLEDLYRHEFQQNAELRNSVQFEDVDNDRTSCQNAKFVSDKTSVVSDGKSNDESMMRRSNKKEKQKEKRKEKEQEMETVKENEKQEQEEGGSVAATTIAEEHQEQTMLKANEIKNAKDEQKEKYKHKRKQIDEENIERDKERESVTVTAIESEHRRWTMLKKTEQKKEKENEQEKYKENDNENGNEHYNENENEAACSYKNEHQETMLKKMEQEKENRKDKHKRKDKEDEKVIEKEHQQQITLKKKAKGKKKEKNKFKEQKKEMEEEEQVEEEKEEQEKVEPKEEQERVQPKEEQEQEGQEQVEKQDGGEKVAAKTIEEANHQLPMLKESQMKRSQPIITSTEIVTAKYTIVRDEAEATDPDDTSHVECPVLEINRALRGDTFLNDQEASQLEKLTLESRRVAQRKSINLVSPNSSDSEDSKNDQENRVDVLSPDSSHIDESDESPRSSCSQIISDASDSDELPGSSRSQIISDPSDSDESIAQSNDTNQQTVMSKSIISQIKEQENFHSSTPLKTIAETPTKNNTNNLEKNSTVRLLTNNARRKREFLEKVLENVSGIDNCTTTCSGEKKHEQLIRHKSIISQIKDQENFHSSTLLKTIAETPTKNNTDNLEKNSTVRLLTNNARRKREFLEKVLENVSGIDNCTTTCSGEKKHKQLIRHKSIISQIKDQENFHSSTPLKTIAETPTKNNTDNLEKNSTVRLLTNNARRKREFLEKVLENVSGIDNCTTACSGEEEHEQLHGNDLRPIELCEFVDREGMVATEQLSTITAKDFKELARENSDEEIWLMEIPKSIITDGVELCGKTMTFEGGKMSINETIYRTKCKEEKSVRCILRSRKNKSRWKTVNMESVGCIVVCQELSDETTFPPPARSVCESRSIVPFPKNIKSRNPLLGLNPPSGMDHFKHAWTNKNTSQILQSKKKQKKNSKDLECQRYCFT